MPHEKFCKSYYPDLIKIEDCNWCDSLSKLRVDIANDVALYFSRHPQFAKVHTDFINKLILGE